MKKKITIGIPRALLYYKYQHLWECFFKSLGCEIILSPNTNKQIIQNGIELSIDESCLSSKIYMGHVQALINQVDYILVPRVATFGRLDNVCVKFNAMYDIINSTFDNVRMLDYNIDVMKGKGELKAFIKMGRELKKSIFRTIWSYIKAKREVSRHNKQQWRDTEQLLNSTKSKILLVGHSYNIHDKLLGIPIIESLTKYGVIPIIADSFNKKQIIIKYKEISPCLYWTYSKELLGSIVHLKDQVDGLIFLSTFPCGPDSLVNELCLRKLGQLPMINIVLDELQSEIGLQTRLESFVDIIKDRKEQQEVKSNE